MLGNDRSRHFLASRALVTGIVRVNQGLARLGPFERKLLVVRGINVVWPVSRLRERKRTTEQAAASVLWQQLPAVITSASILRRRILAARHSNFVETFAPRCSCLALLFLIVYETRWGRSWRSLLAEIPGPVVISLESNGHPSTSRPSSITRNERSSSTLPRACSPSNEERRWP